MPKFDYHLDESDADVLVLRRQDGTFVAAFSALGASRDGIVEAAKQDYEALVRRNPGSPASAAGEHPSVRASRPIHRTAQVPVVACQLTSEGNPAFVFGID